MKNLKASILQKRKETYLKLQDRFVKSLKKGDFESKNGRSKNHWISQLKKLERQLGVVSNLKLKHWALAFALGFVTIVGNAQEKPTQERRFGSFKHGAEISNKRITKNKTNTSSKSQAVSIFSEQPLLGDALLSDEIVVGDFDNDGDLDLLIFGYYSPTRLFLNDGVGDISAVREVWSPSYEIDDALVGDIDGDGLLDIVISQENSSNQTAFSYLINNGSGYFTESASVFGPRVRLLELSDIDNDGDLDILVKEDIGGYVYELKVRTNDGAGNFTVGPGISFIQNTNNLNVNLFTSDAFPDLVLMDGDTLKVFVNDGLGGFTAGSSIQTLVTGTDYNYVEIGDNGDTDNDGDVDLILTISDKIFHLANDGTGAFVQTTIKENLDANLQFYYDDLFLSNLDSDPGLEIIVNEEINNLTTGQSFREDLVFFNDGGNLFTESGQTLSMTSTTGDESNPIPIDFDGDGDNDLILSNYINLETFENDGTGNFTSLDDNIVEVFYAITELVDIDGDTDLDIVMGAYSPGILINDGLGNFTLGQDIAFTATEQYNDVVTSDFDNDGDIDIVFTNDDYNQFHLWNNTAGNFALAQSFASANTSQEIESIEAAEMDGDAFIDVVTFVRSDTTFANQIDIWRNTGAGSFVQETFVTANELEDLTLADIDGDGDLDIIGIAEDNYGTSLGLATYINTAGSLSIGSIVAPLALSFEFDYITAADIDGDGDGDFICTDNYNSQAEINLFTNDGSGAFTNTVIATTDAYGGVVVEDFDLDGDMDLYITGGDYNDEFWNNDGTGVFTLVGTLDSKTYYFAVAGDIDGDGDKDILTLENYQGNRIIINNTNMPVANIAIDSAQLVVVYDETGGDSWTNNTNWKTGDVATWFGVSVANNRVISLGLPNNNVTGSFTVNSGMDSLAVLDLSGNLLTGIPDLSASNITALDVSKNQLEFGSLEPNALIPGINYLEQGTIGTASTPAALAGDDFILSITTSGTANQYQWFKDTGAIAGATSSTHTLSVIDITDEADYHCEVTNTIVTGLTLTTEITSLSIQSVLELDSTQLVVLYDETGGDSWTDNTNWKTGDVSTWFGMTVTNDRVSSIVLQNNNLTGSISVNTGLDSLTTLDVSGNLLTGIPDLSGTSITTLDFSDNKLEFGSLEPNAAIPGIDYSNQGTIGSASTVTVPAGSDSLVSITTTGTANLYQWFKDGTSITGATNSSYTVVSINTNEMGDYHCEVTNTIVTGLTLSSEITTLEAEASISGMVFLDDASTALNNGEITLLRITNTAGYDTTSVVNVGTDGTYTHSNILLGDYISMAQADTTAFPNHLPTYWGEIINTILWEEADTIRLDSITVGINVILEGVPVDKPAGEGIISGILEEEIPEGGRLEAKRRVAGAGVSVRRQHKSGKDEEHGLELVDYVYTNDEGEFKFENLEEDIYTFNIQYPGFPMDENSNLEIEVTDLELETQVTALVAEGVISVAVIKITGLKSLPEYESVKLYPNPTGEMLFINQINSLDKNYRVSIFNAKGQEVLHQNYKISKNQGIKVSHLEAGIYIVHLGNPNKKDTVVKSFKIIIER